MQGGFSLIEMALVIAIAGVVVSSVMASFATYLELTKSEKAKTDMATIQAAIQEYYVSTGRLPCPAPLNAQPDTGGYGKEARNGGPPASCNGAPGGPGVFNVAGARDPDGAGPLNPATGTPAGTNASVFIGGIPTRTLNLPDQYALDPWNGRYTYAVSNVLIDVLTYDDNLGGIDIVDSTNATVLATAGDAHYVIISHGASNVGAFTSNGAAGIGCPAAGTTMDTHNCDRADATFRRAPASDAGGAAFYDDYLLFRSTAVITNQEVPIGMVVAFNRDSCPAGWMLKNNFAGRTIIGAGTYTDTYQIPPLPAAPVRQWNFNQTYTSNSQGGFATWKMDELEMATHRHQALAGAFPMSLALINAGGPTATLYYAANKPPPGGPPPLGPPLNSSVDGGITGGTDVEAMPNMPPFIALIYCEKF